MHPQTFLNIYNVSALTLHALLGRNRLLDMIGLLIGVKWADGYIVASFPNAT